MFYGEHGAKLGAARMDEKDAHDAGRAIDEERHKSSVNEFKQPRDTQNWRQNRRASSPESWRQGAFDVRPESARKPQRPTTATRERL